MKRKVVAGPARSEAGEEDEAPPVEAMGGEPSPCTDYPPCSRAGCGAPACSHDVPEPHPCAATSCAAYLFPDGMDASDFRGGGGGFGGGGASGGW